MASSIIAHLHFGGADLSFRKKFRLFFTVAVVVLALGCVSYRSKLCRSDQWLRHPACCKMKVIQTV